ncbi:DUF3397 family protein [Ureibacillus galli]|nr:DUF3397 family protein [Ureibacillus galli]
MIQYIVSTIIFFPIILFFITYVIWRKRKKTNIQSIGTAADVTTFVLFFSVPLSIASLWGENYSGIVFIVAIFIAIIFTYIDWRTKKEIKILSLFKKIWRLFFILLTISYIVIWFVGLIQSIMNLVLI